MTRTAFLLSTFAALALACGDDSTTTDAGEDATTPDVAAKDVSPDAPKQDAASDATSDATTDASTDAGADAIAEAGGDGATTLDAGPSCDGGCKLFSYDCKNGNFPPCTCLALNGNDPNPTCKNGTVSCFVDPCQGKAAVCVSGSCVVQ